MATFKKRGVKGQEKWTVIFDLPSNDNVRKQKRLSGFKTRQDANLAHIAFLANYKPPKKENHKTGSSNFESVFSIFLNDLSHGIKESTFMNTEDNYRNHLLPYFIDRKVHEIDAREVSDFLLTLEDKGLSYSTIKKIKGILSRFFTYCIDEKHISINPCVKAIKLKNTAIQKEMLVWDENEFALFIKNVDNFVYRCFFTCLYLTGCRRGEALALTWKDISEKEIRVNKSLTYHARKARYNVTPPKNSYSNRSIIVPTALIQMLDKLKQEYKSYELFSEENFVFGNLTPLPKQSIMNQLKRGCEKAGVKLIRVHDFRHSHASLLISKNHDIVTIARRLGHKNIKMTLDKYAHLMPNKQHELLSTLDKIL